MINSQPLTPPREENIDWPGCKEATLITYDFHRQTGATALSSVLERPITKGRSLVEKAKLFAGVVYTLLTYED
jgi:hypothetical protein